MANELLATFIHNVLRALYHVLRKAPTDIILQVSFCKSPWIDPSISWRSVLYYGEDKLSRFIRVGLQPLGCDTSVCAALLGRTGEKRRAAPIARR